LHIYWLHRLVYFISYGTWVQVGGEHGERVPHFFRRWGYNMACPSTFFHLGLWNLEKFQK